MFNLQCGNCAHKLAVPPTYAGQRIKCSKCQGPIDVPFEVADGMQDSMLQRPTPPVQAPGPQQRPAPQGYGQQGYRQQGYDPQGHPDHGGYERNFPTPARRPSRRAPKQNHAVIVVVAVVILAAVLIGVIVLVANEKGDDRQRTINEHDAKTQEILDQNERNRKKAMENAGNQAGIPSPNDDKEKMKDAGTE